MQATAGFAFSIATALNLTIGSFWKIMITDKSAEVFRMMGSEIIAADDPLTETFWLVLYQDFDVEMQEDLFRRFDKRYTRLVSYTVGGVRMYRYGASFKGTTP